jgi:serine phosphatase RsbU (regulator of sigma subunit)
LIGGLAIVPLASAVLAEKLGRLLVIDALTLVAAVVAIQATGAGYDVAQWTRLGLIVFASVYSYWAAYRRIKQSERFVSLGEVARSAQRAIMRPDPPTVDGVDVEVRYLSAARQAQIGGDVYEAVDTPFGLRVLVADARGKGLDAVRSAAAVVGSFREWAQEEKELADLLCRLNGSARRELPRDDFVTALVAQLDGLRLTFALSGHPAPVRFRGALAQSLQVPPTAPLSLFDDDELPIAGQIELEPGDLILMYSDGLSEARDAQGRFFPFDAELSRLLADNPDARLDVLISEFLEVLREFVNSNLGDDMVLVAVRLAEDDVA